MATMASMDMRRSGSALIELLGHGWGMRYPRLDAKSGWPNARKAGFMKSNIKFCGHTKCRNKDLDTVCGLGIPGPKADVILSIIPGVAQLVYTLELAVCMERIGTHARMYDLPGRFAVYLA